MPHRIVFTDSAIVDLTHIYDWIVDATGDDPLATAYIEGLKRRCTGLADFPRIGSPRADGNRSIVVDRRAVILYRVTRDSVVVLGVYHRGRDPEA